MTVQICEAAGFRSVLHGTFGGALFLLERRSNGQPVRSPTSALPFRWRPFYLLVGHEGQLQICERGALPVGSSISTFLALGGRPMGRSGSFAKRVGGALSNRGAGGWGTLMASSSSSSATAGATGREDGRPELTTGMAAAFAVCPAFICARVIDAVSSS